MPSSGCTLNLTKMQQQLQSATTNVARHIMSPRSKFNILRLARFAVHTSTKTVPTSIRTVHLPTTIVGVRTSSLLDTYIQGSGVKSSWCNGCSNTELTPPQKQTLQLNARMYPHKPQWHGVSTINWCEEISIWELHLVSCITREQVEEYHQHQLKDTIVTSFNMTNNYDNINNLIFFLLSLFLLYLSIPLETCLPRIVKTI